MVLESLTELLSLCAYFFLLFKMMVVKFFVKLANRLGERRFHYRMVKILVRWNCVMAGSSDSQTEKQTRK